MHLSVLDLIYQRAGMVRSNPAVSVLRNGTWLDLRFEDIQRMAQHLSNYLIETGIKAGDRIAIISESNPEFGVVFFAAVRAGAILVPLQPDLPEDELRAQLVDSAPKIVFASQRCFDKASHMVSVLDSEHSTNTSLICIEDSSDVNQKTLQSVSTHILHEGCERQLEETALIVYTAGTTSEAKGVMLSFSNLLFQADCLQQLFEVGKRDLFMSVLPMANVTELTLGYLGVLFAGGQICYIPDSTFKLEMKELHKRNNTYMITTSSFLVSVKSLIEKRLAKSSMQRRLSFKMRFGLAKLLPRRARRQLFPIIHELFGSQFRSFISTGAPLLKDVECFLDTVGVDVYHGYGLTEASALATINSNDNFRMYSVGKPLPGIEVRLIGSKGVGDEGEIVIRGDQVMRGYFNDEEKTNVAIDASGLLYTGDLGVFDEDGFLYINGRIKDLIHLTNGTKFFPYEVEQAILRSAVIKDVCVVGVREPNSFHHHEVVAVVVPEKSQRASTIRRLVELQMQDLMAFKRPNRIVIAFESLPRTTSGELRRGAIVAWLKNHESANK